MAKADTPQSMVEVAEMTARRRAPSSPRRKQQLRELRWFATAMVVLTGSSLIYIWLLLA